MIGSQPSDMAHTVIEVEPSGDGAEHDTQNKQKSPSHSTTEQCLTSIQAHPAADALPDLHTTLTLTEDWLDKCHTPEHEP